MKHTRKTQQKAPALPLFFEGFSIILGVLIGHFVFDQLLFGLCFGAAAGIALSMISELIRGRKERKQSLQTAEQEPSASEPAPTEEEPVQAEKSEEAQPSGQEEKTDAPWERL